MVSSKSAYRSVVGTLALSCTASASAVAMMPRETQAGDKIAAVVGAPQPTSPPARRYGVMPLLDARANGLNTCGYISGSSSYYPLTCVATETCTNYGSYRGCCEGSSCTSTGVFFTECHDATAPICSGSVGGGTLCCTYTSLYPYCLTYLWSTTASPGEVFTQYNCDQASFSGQYFLAASAPLTTSTSTSTSSTTATSTPTSSTASATPTVPGNSNVSGSQGSDNSSSTPVGAIVGGVIGGVAVLAIIGFGLWWFLRKKNDNAATSGGAQTQGPPGAAMAQHSSPPPGGQYHDPRYSLVPGGPVDGSGVTPYGSPYQGQPTQPYYQPQPYDPAKSPVPMQTTGGSGNHPYNSTPQHTGGSGAGYYQPPPHQGQNIAHEVPADSVVGTGGNRAELS